MKELKTGARLTPDEELHRAVSHLQRPLQGTAQERAEQGKATRAAVPRANHGAWKASRDRQDPIDLLEAQATTRLPDLMPIRYGRMLASPFTFYRGAAAIVAADLARPPTRGCASSSAATRIWPTLAVSGRRNAISYSTSMTSTRPFRAPWEWDVKRLAASFEVAGQARGFAVGAYLGGSDAFDRALADVAVAYADQNERDHKALVQAVKSGRVRAETGL